MFPSAAPASPPRSRPRTSFSHPRIRLTSPARSFIPTAAKLSTAKNGTPQENVRAAKSAGLHYISDGGRGITREKHGKDFVYLNTRGRRIRDVDTLTRIRNLAIPPAYHDVWISADPHGHIQAVGRDDRGRKQYRYH